MTIKNEDISIRLRGNNTVSVFFGDEAVVSINYIAKVARVIAKGKDEDFTEILIDEEYNKKNEIKEVRFAFRKIK
jgi:hypothetical protein